MAEGLSYRSSSVHILVTTLVALTLAGCIQPLPEGEQQATAGSADGPGINVARCGSKWCATATYTDTGSLDNKVQVNLDVFNGPISVDRTNGDATITLTVEAKASSQTAARDAVAKTRVRMEVGGTEAVAVAENPYTRGAPIGVSLGASIEASLAGTLSGLIDTSNGPISISDLSLQDIAVDTSNGPLTFRNVVAKDMDADTSNGPISGDLDASGDLTLDTSNGPIDMTLTPRSSGEWTIDTSNGGIDLRLAESSSIAYDLYVDTSNGGISESMSEAEFHGEDGDDDEGYLRTTGGLGRVIQITGDIDTSNGSVEFEEA